MKFQYGPGAALSHDGVVYVADQDGVLELPPNVAHAVSPFGLKPYAEIEEATEEDGRRVTKAELQERAAKVDLKLDLRRPLDYLLGLVEEKEKIAMGVSQEGA